MAENPDRPTPFLFLRQVRFLSSSATNCTTQPQCQPLRLKECHSASKFIEQNELPDSDLRQTYTEMNAVNATVHRIGRFYSQTKPGGARRDEAMADAGRTTTLR